MQDWVIVLVKDFASAKQRLGPALDVRERRSLARRNARRAIHAAAGGVHQLVVAGSDEVGALAEKLGAEHIVEERQEGQNTAPCGRAEPHAWQVWASGRRRRKSPIGIR